MSALAVEQIQLIDLGKLEVHPSNPRKDVGDITELAASIKSAGLIEPIVAVKHNGTFQVVAGSRRLAAARSAKLRNVPVRVMDLDEAQAMAAALIENLQRKDLEPLEQAEAFRGWLTLTGRTQKELGETVGLAPSTIANALRLLEAPKLVQDALRAKTIGAEHARVALTVPADFASGLTLKKGVTVEQLREEARDLTAAHELVSRIKAEVEDARTKAKDQPGHVVTWDDAKLWAGRRQYGLIDILGKPPVKIAGAISGYIDLGNYNRTDGDIALHDKTCECRALGITEDAYDRGGKLRRVCVVVAGYRKYVAALSKARFGKGGRRLPPKQTPAQRQKDRKAKDKRADQEAARALEVRVDAPYSANARAGAGTKIDAKLLKGGPAGENARVALFALTAREIWTADGGRVALWKRIERLSIAKIRELLAQHGAARALEIVLSRKDEREQLTEAIYGHYGIAIPEPEKKPAKKRAAR